MKAFFKAAFVLMFIGVLFVGNLWFEHAVAHWFGGGDGPALLEMFADMVVGVLCFILLYNASQCRVIE